MQYPLELRFKLMTLGQRITATDGNGQLVMFIKQRMLKLKEHVDVYADVEQTRVLFTVKADRVIDFSANYHFTDAQGNDWGSVRRQGMRSLWSAHYDVIQDGQVDMTIQEESAIKKLVESLLGEIPFFGLLAIYYLNPSYIIRRPDGTPLLRLIKRPAWFEGHFTLEKWSEMPEDDELRSLLSVLTMILLERRRG